MLDSSNFHDGFIGMPLIRADVKHGQELQSHGIKQGRKAGTPVGDGRMGDLDRESGFEDEADVSK